MELLIPGLILVALMVWASTKIKKTAAGAFEPEFIETENYSLQKPEGFLHVIGDPEHEFVAYSKDFGKGDTGMRQATIEIDVVPGEDLITIRDAITSSATSFDVKVGTSAKIELNAEEEPANQTAVIAFYKIAATKGGAYRLRFAVLPEYKDAFLRKIEETIDSFTIKTK